MVVLALVWGSDFPVWKDLTQLRVKSRITGHRTIPSPGGNQAVSREYLLLLCVLGEAVRWDMPELSSHRLF